jgi:hypothetical protein
MRAGDRLESLAYVVECGHQASTIAFLPLAGPRLFEHLCEVGPAKIRHAHQPETGVGIIVHGMDRHDVRMLKPGEHLGLLAFGLRDLQRNLAVGQVKLLGQEDSSERAAAQFRHEPKASDHLARPGQ